MGHPEPRRAGVLGPASPPVPMDDPQHDFRLPHSLGARHPASRMHRTDRLSRPRVRRRRLSRLRRWRTRPLSVGRRADVERTARSAKTRGGDAVPPKASAQRRHRDRHVARSPGGQDPRADDPVRARMGGLAPRPPLHRSGLRRPADLPQAAQGTHDVPRGLCKTADGRSNAFGKIKMWVRTCVIATLFVRTATGIADGPLMALAAAMLALAIMLAALSFAFHLLPSRS